MSGTRQKIQREQLLMAFASEGRGEFPDTEYKGTEPLVAKPAVESPAKEVRLMEEVCDRNNLEIAWKRVRGNKGSPGVDGMTIDDTRLAHQQVSGECQDIRRCSKLYEITISIRSVFRE
jgi:RNA-directed DNA polymerase